MKTRSPIGSSILACLALGFTVAVGGCASTDMTSTWTDPAAKGASLAKVAVVCLTREPGLRRMTEDAAASRLGGAQAVPSYKILGETDLRDREAVTTTLRKQGFQGVLLIRMAAITEQITPAPAPYGSFNSYYGWAAGAVYDPAYLQRVTFVNIVSNLYSLADDNLIWSGVSQTLTPASAKESMTSVSNVFARSIQKDRLVL